MNRKNWLFISLICSCVFTQELGFAMEGASGALQITIPVILKKGNAVFNVGQVALLDNKSIALGHVSILLDDFETQKTKGQIIAIFHTEAGYVMLDDAKYNEFRSTNTGNPYKEFIFSLMKRGIQFELCGATAKAHHWVNGDLISGLKVNTDAMIRLTQLGQDGFVIIDE